MWKIVPAGDFENYREAWDGLNDRHYQCPVLNSAFPHCALQEFADGDEVLAILGDPGDPDAMTILSKRKLVLWDTFQASQAPIGFWISTPEIQQNLLDAMRSLAKALPGYIYQLGISQQDPLILPRPDGVAGISTLDYIETGRILVDRSFDEYWASRGKNLRHNLKRQKNRLEREGVEIRLELATTHQDVARAITEYGTLESKGWKAEGNTAISPDNSQGRFYQSLFKDFCDRDAALVPSYFYDSKLVACDLCIMQGGTLVILKTTYDETQKTSSPALLMRRDAFPALFESGDIKVIEFYGRVMDWHRKWTEDFRTMYHINLK